MQPASMANRLSLLCAVFLLCVVNLSSAQDFFRLCVPQDSMPACNSISQFKINCIMGRDRIDCLDKIHNNEADFTTVEPEDMYVAANIPGQNFIIFMEIRSAQNPADAHRYEAVAVVHNSLNLANILELQGRNSCHTGVGRTVGYKIPVTKLSHFGVLGSMDESGLTPRENELKALSQAFDRACIVGKWAPDEETNRRLKTTYRDLCALCENPDICDYPDRYSGYNGSLYCLKEKGGDVAWTKTAAVKEFFGLDDGTAPQADANQFSYLCPDGTKKPVTGPPCSWAARPWLAFIGRAGQQNVDELRKAITLAKNNGNVTLLTSTLGLKQGLTAVDREPISPQDFLSNSLYNDVIERASGPTDSQIQMCVRNEAEEKKCRALSSAAFSRTVRPRITCVRKTQDNDCLQALKDGVADIMTTDAAVTYKASRQYNLHAVVSEIQSPASEAEYHVVAVVKKNSQFSKMEELAGARSCYSDHNKLANMKATHTCSTSGPAPSNHAKEDAFKCVVNGDADVAFVTADIPIKYTDGKSSESWAEGLKSEDFRILCAHNNTPITEFRSCSVFNIPTRAIVTSNYKSETRIEEIRMAFQEISTLFGVKRPDVFRLFGDFDGQKDVMFTNSAAELQVLDPDVSQQLKFDALMDRVASEGCN